MTKYFLNIEQSGKSDDMVEGNITRKFDLETPLLFPFSLFIDDNRQPSWNSSKYLEIKTNKKDSEFYHDVDSKGGIANKFSPIENYWNLCVPDDMKGFSMTGYGDKLTLDDTEGKIYLELYHFPHSTLEIKPTEVEWETNNYLRIKISPIKSKEIEISKINLEGENVVKKMSSNIHNCIEKGDYLTLNFHSPNSTYFQRNYSNGQITHTLVIPENSLQEDLNNQNQNNYSPSSDKYFYFLIIGIIVVISLLLLFFFLVKKQKIRKNN